MKREYTQQTWDLNVQYDLIRLATLAICEDSLPQPDLTSTAFISPDAKGKADIVAREAGVLAGARGVADIIRLYDPSLVWTAFLDDGQPLEKGTRVGEISGRVIGLLGVERIVLNLLGHLCGIASLTRQYVDRIAGTKAKIYDTRKTTLGWRRLEKYAVHCGGGTNHRMGLYDHILIKDNHLAFAATEGTTPAQAVRRAKEFLAGSFPDRDSMRRPMVEIEVDTLDQLGEVLPECPDIVLLDNMEPARLKQAVAMREASGVATELEASGGVQLATVYDIA
ncbi:MAG: carboxylating nicotinate-nucleotide diphosphorylase, partial [Thermoguttaceae bacterium]|nr:carboxylating nicotinate-nucleotide diphosphorylase [Thermoguttaceae bacterium]